MENLSSQRKTTRAVQRKGKLRRSSEVQKTCSLFIDVFWNRAANNDSFFQHWDSLVQKQFKIQRILIYSHKWQRNSKYSRLRVWNQQMFDILLGKKITFNLHLNYILFTVVFSSLQGRTGWKWRAVFLVGATLEGALCSTPPTTLPPPIMRIIHPYIHSQRSTAHCNTTMGKPLQSTWTYTECCVFFSSFSSWPLNSQCNQHNLNHCAGNQSACELSPVSAANSAAEKCYRFRCDDVLTFWQMYTFSSFCCVSL